MIVLGKNSADKGKQLEQLTGQILKDGGYVNLRYRIIGTGGSELDIKGEWVRSVPGGEERHILIGECKAYQDPVSTIDWLKLVGRLHVEQKESKENVDAVLVGLNGYNGNVLGAYESYRRSAKDIRLIFPEDIEKATRDSYGVCEAKVLLGSLSSFTPEIPVGTDVAYYGGAVYWCIEFDGRRLAFMDAQGNPLEDKRSRTLHKMHVAQLGRSKLIDLTKESEALVRRNNVAKVHIAALFLVGGEMEKPSLFSDGEFSSKDHQTALDYLLEEKMVSMEGEKVRLSFMDNPEPTMEFASLIAFWLRGLSPLAYLPLLFGSALYDQSIDGRTVQKVREIQGDLPIPPEREGEAIAWMRLSPSALLNALSPQAMLVQHRVHDKIEQAHIDEYDLTWFFNLLIDCFVSDFHNPPLVAYYFLKGLRGVEQRTTLKVTTAFGPEEIVRHPSRVFIAPLAEEIGGSFALVNALETVGSPYDLGSAATSNFLSNVRRATGDKAYLYVQDDVTLSWLVNERESPFPEHGAA